VAFHASFGINERSGTCLAAIFLLVLGWKLVALRRLRAFHPGQTHELVTRAFCSTALPLLIGALIVNLKRGPWFGVAVATLFLLSLFARRLVLPFVLVTVGLFFYLSPVNTRAFHSSADFFISGGRHEIWDVGTDLAIKFPLGIGFKNGDFLRRFSPNIPPEISHFHSNFLNIIVESGLLCAVLFGWWVIRMLRLSWKGDRRVPSFVLAIALSASFLSWQLAGLVEYNFGDSEVLLIAYAISGMLVRIVREREDAPNVTAHP
jgi:O-antigen ligase